MSTRQLLISAWSWNPLLLAAALAVLLVCWRLYHGKGRIRWLMAALALFFLAVASPIQALSRGYLFSAHMLQHILLLLGVPGFVLMSLPRSASLGIRPRLLGHPIIGWLAGVGAMWVWHWPALCNAAGSSQPVYVSQTISLLVMGALFWRQVVAPREKERLSPPAAVLYLFSACAACSVLGIILTLSPVTVCSIYATPPVDRLGILSTIRSDWGMTPDKDQQIGGLLMWVPMCLIYLGAIFGQIARWFGETTVRHPAPQQQ